MTIADREAETAMRALIKGAFPDHAVFGEEHGLELGAGGSSEWLWVLDPIDGTKSFITGGCGGARMRERLPKWSCRPACTLRGCSTSNFCAPPGTHCVAHPPPISGKPLFGTLISLLHRGTPLLGVIDQPMLRERWLGVAGQASTLNGAPIRTRPCGEVGAAYMYSTTPHMFSGDNEVRVHVYVCVL